MHDVIVVGAGPAGSLTAMLLARAGARVLVLDRATFPRDKLCGDTVNPGALAILRRHGLADAVAGSLPVDGMIVTGAGGVRITGLYGGGIQGRAIRRRDLDVRLVQAAASAGARIGESSLVAGPHLETTSTSYRVGGVIVRAGDGRHRRLAASLVIAADGRYSRISRELGLSRHPDRPRRWAVGAYFEGVAGVTSCGEMHVREDRYIGVAPVPGGIVNTCVVSADRAALRNPKRLLLETLRDDRQLAERFAAARLVERPVCLGPMAVECTDAGMDGLLLAGDAAGFIDPMTGDGLRFALRGAELAAEAALRALEHGWDAAHVRLREAREREFAPKWRFNRALRLLVASPAAVRLAGRSASIAPAVVRSLVKYAADLRVA